MILTLRTEKPESEIGLYDGEKKLAYETWQAHRQLAETIHAKIQEQLDGQKAGLGDITGIVIYKGPGSFTGLRIGMSVANALAYSLDVPITASQGDDWLQTGIQALASRPTKTPVAPEYGMPAAVTTQKK